ncbi:unnamed protein product [Pedinophyceae sp. YPF-701]|nr:unnamed protein product [Pedinophyceae sp. YPF-701]
MAAAATLAGIGVIPTSCATFDVVWSKLVPLAAAMLLLEQPLNRLASRRGSNWQCLAAFVVGAVGSVVGAFAGWAAVRSGAWLGPEGYKIAGAITASYIGGSVNMAATAAALGLASPALVAGAAAADNVVMGVYIAGCAAIGVAEIARSARAAGRAGPSPFAGAGELGGVLMLLFFATIGATAGGWRALADAPALLLYCGVQVGVHLAFTLAVGRALKLPLRAVLVASNANVGGPATAAAMASGRGWSDLVQPGLLTGALGYTVGTVIGLAVARLLM